MCVGVYRSHWGGVGEYKGHFGGGVWLSIGCMGVYRAHGAVSVYIGSKGVCIVSIGVTGRVFGWL